MDLPSTTEYAVQMTCNSCVNAVKKTLEGVDGIRSFDINLEEQRVVVKSVLLSSQIKELIEKSGRKVALQGYGSEHAGKNLGAAVAAIDMGKNMVQGVIRLVQTSPKMCLIEGTIDGLKPGVHRLGIHEYGDISNGCNSCGEIYGLKQNFDTTVPGNLDVIKAEQTGRSDFRMVKDNLSISDIIGRSIVIHEGKDVSFTDNSSVRVGCGIIARSPGLFQNTKKICACDGINVWNEKVQQGSTAENELPNARM